MTVGDLIEILRGLNNPDMPIHYIYGDDITGVKIITNLGKDVRKETELFMTGNFWTCKTRVRHGDKKNH